MNNHLAKIALLVAVASLGACAPYRPINDQPPVGTSARGGAQSELGVISAIERLSANGQVTGGGAVAGGVAGAVIGRQFGGGGGGRAAGTFLGAVAGLLIGNEVEKQNSGTREGVRVSVRLDSGAQRSFDFSHAGDLRIGDRVRVEGNQLLRN